MSGFRRWARVVGILTVLLGGTAVAAPAGARPAQVLACGSVVTESTALPADVGPCPDDGLIIAASGITLDLGGHRVIGTYDPLLRTPPTDDGITFRQVEGSRVRNGEVMGFATGVKIDGGGGNRVTRMHVHDNIGRPAAGDGIAVYGSQGNRIDRNRVIHNGPASGITLLAGDSPESPGPSRNEVTDNVVLDNNLPELGSDGTPNWRRDIGIAIEGPGATHNQVVGNLVENSGTHGIQVFPACSTGYDISTGCPGTVANDHNVIRNNRVNGNGVAAPTEGMPLGDGISVLSMGPSMVKMPGHTIVENNTTDGNQRNGISLGGGNGQELATGTWTTGGETYGCHRSQGGDPDNPIVDSPDLCGVNSNTVVRNSARGTAAPASSWALAPTTTPCRTTRRRATAPTASPSASPCATTRTRTRCATRTGTWSPSPAPGAGTTSSSTIRPRATAAGTAPTRTPPAPVTGGPATASSAQREPAVRGVSDAATAPE